MKVRPLPLLLLTAVALWFPAEAPAQPGSPPPGPAPAALFEAPEPDEISLPKEGLVRLEVFTLSLEEGRTATRKFPKQADLYAWLGAELEQEKPKATLERLMLVRVRAGQKSKLEEIDEYPSPTAFKAPAIPQTVTIGPQDAATSAPATPAAKTGAASPEAAPGNPPVPAGISPADRIFPPWPYTAATPQSFAFKSTGWTVEIELTVADDGKTVDLNLAPELVRFCGLEAQSPNGEIRQAVFETSKIATQILTKFDQPTLAGTFSPPVDAGAPGGNLENVTRLLFITVTDPR